MLHHIDHLVFAVPNLEQAIEDIASRFGVHPVVGGRHLKQGTHNALLRIGQQSYLELIALDAGNQDVVSNRWMGVDTDLGEGRLTRWAMTSSNIDQDLTILATHNSELGIMREGTRKKADGTTLRWKLSMPLPMPQIEIAPFLIDWSGSTHPTESLPLLCRLMSFKAKHPEPERFQSLFNKLRVAINIEKGDKISLVAEIATPNGIVELS